MLSLLNAVDVLVSRYAVSSVPVWPVTVESVKAQAQIDHALDDTFLLTQDGLLGVIPAVVGMVERYSGIALIEQTRKLIWDGGFPSSREITLPIGPVSSVTEIKYLDDTYTEKTVASTLYRVINVGIPARVALKLDYSWPSAKPDAACCWVTYKAGFGQAATAVPAEWLHAIEAMCAWRYEFRDAGEGEMLLQFGRILEACGARVRG